MLLVCLYRLDDTVTSAPLKHEFAIFPFALQESGMEVVLNQAVSCIKKLLCTFPVNGTDLFDGFVTPLVDLRDLDEVCLFSR